MKPVTPDATVLVECHYCPELLEVPTGSRGVEEAAARGWDVTGGGDLVCPECTEAREELIGDECGKPTSEREGLVCDGCYEAVYWMIQDYDVD